MGTEDLSVWPCLTLFHVKTGCSPTLSPLRLVAIDLETTHDGVFVSMGAVKERRPYFATTLSQAQRILTHLLSGTDALVGHNLLAFDIPWLLDHGFDASLRTIPVIDTLFLSPLAFPANPYHRLVKDYKIVSDAVNDPVHDAGLSLSLLADEVAAFQRTPPVLLQLYARLFSQFREPEHPANFAGIARLFALLAPAPCSDSALQAALFEYLEPFACPNRLKAFITDTFADSTKAALLAYTAAWLPVAGANSVVPAWVRHRWPAIDDALHRLRTEDCGAPDCAYCRKNHNVFAQLKRWFGFENFRPLPDGRPLQHDITEAAMADQSLLAILPTGGGKSLCYQLPALVRHERDSSLTVIISPLQALMKDQVDNLAQKTGTTAAAALCGLLTLPERGAVMDRVIKGDVALLYLSPEQLRNARVKKLLMTRRIGCWVFDEAHCLSKWGHDFRPDYLYCVRVIRELAERQKTPVPPVQAFTATAKPDVIRDITESFRPVLTGTLPLFAGGVERSNLHFSVEYVKALEKPERLLWLLDSVLADSQAAAIVYCATTKSCDVACGLIVQARPDWPVSSFYARLPAPRKKEIIENFVAGKLRIICATNAFGMGIDKDNIRLVVHYEIPGSLENYLQEAGRAGRDLKDADCALFYDPDDIDKQFSLAARSEVTVADMNAVLRAVKCRTKEVFTAQKRKENNKPLADRDVKALWEKANVSDYPEIVDTVGELLAGSDEDGGFGLGESQDTKLRTAVAWLECAGFMRRTDNCTQVFQGLPRFTSLEDAKRRIKALSLTPRAQALWIAIITAILMTPQDEGVSADSLAAAVGPGLTPSERQAVSAKDVMRVLTQMTQAGLIERSMLITLLVKPALLEGLVCTVIDTEREFLALLREVAPDADNGLRYPLNLAQAVKDLADRDAKTEAAVLRNILTTWENDGASDGAKGAVSLSHAGRNQYFMSLNRSWGEMEILLKRRHALARTLAGFILKTSGSRRESSREELVGFPIENLIAAISAAPEFAGWSSDKCEQAAERVLLYFHEQKIVNLQSGMAIFRQALTLQLTAETTRKYTKEDYAALAAHYGEKNVQIHVMNEYADLGRRSMALARAFAADYFAMNDKDFINKYFKGRKAVLDTASSAATHRRIVDELNNPEQQAVVTAPRNTNQLVIAGPGSGKSKVILHRTAWLIRVKQTAPQAILVLCYNHSTAVSLRKRLRALIGEDANRVTIRTFHSFALSLAGRTLQTSELNSPDLSTVIREATALLTGKKAIFGAKPETQREELLAGLKYLLVDEYQDIDSEQYEFIAALVGKCEPDDDVKMHLTAAGDDDQAIYGFRNASVTYIRQFEREYGAQRRFLSFNYRSTQRIIEAANAVIAENVNRLKSGHPGVIAPEHALELPGGRWENLDETHGRVSIIDADNARHQAALVAAAIKDIRAKAPDCAFSDIAVLSRNGLTKEELTAVRSVFEDEGIPCCRAIPKENGFPVSQIIEVMHFRATLKAAGATLVTRQMLLAMAPETNTRWSQWLRNLINDWCDATGTDTTPATWFADEFTELLGEERRSIRFGSGVLLSTVHGVKGEEFKVVIILDGGWRLSTDKAAKEEERRLYYVGMTRAMERLLLMRRHDVQNPFLNCVARLAAVTTYNTSPVARLRRYHVLGMSDLWLSWAGLQAQDTPSRKALVAAKAGDRVQLKGTKQGLVIANEHGVTLGKLSTKASAQWQSKLPYVLEARLLGLVVRTAKQSHAAGMDLAYATDEWLVPVVEVVTDAGNTATKPQPEIVSSDTFTPSALTANQAAGNVFERIVVTTNVRNTDSQSPKK